jgi:hypothetical protein
MQHNAHNIIQYNINTTTTTKLQVRTLKQFSSRYVATDRKILPSSRRLGIRDKYRDPTDTVRLHRQIVIGLPNTFKRGVPGFH